MRQAKMELQTLTLSRLNNKTATQDNMQDKGGIEVDKSQDRAKTKPKTGKKITLHGKNGSP